MSSPTLYSINILINLIDDLKYFLLLLYIICKLLFGIEPIVICKCVMLFITLKTPIKTIESQACPTTMTNIKEGSWILSSPWPRSITYLASLSSSILRCDLHLVSGNHNRSQTSHSDAPLPFGRKLISWAIVLWRWRENPKASRGKMLPSPMPPDPQATKIVITAYNAFSCFCRCQTLNYCQYFANKPRPRRGKLININNV